MENFISGGINYHTVNKYVKRHFGAKLKVSRKSHIKKDLNAVESFRKNFRIILENLLKNAPEIYTHFNLFVQDESWFGLFIRNGRALTAKGVKPICNYQNIFKSTYVFGAFYLITEIVWWWKWHTAMEVISKFF